VRNQGDRDREGNLGQTRKDPATPTGTSGRQGNKGTENRQQGNPDSNRQGGTRQTPDDDDGPGLGNRMGSR
jgi:hypothetical protein